MSMKTDDERLKEIDALQKQVVLQQQQLDTLHQALKSKQDQVIEWKNSTVTKFENATAKLTELENRIKVLETK
jgi:hypothetical protein